MSEKGSDELLREQGTWPRVQSARQEHDERQRAFSEREDEAIGAALERHGDELDDAEHAIDA